MTKKYIYKFILGFGICIFVFFLSSKSNNNIACAKTWNTCPGAGGVPVSDKYPGQSTTDSVDIKIEIRGNNIPPNQQFTVDAGAPACSDIICLTRSGTANITYTGGVGTGIIDSIGCSSTESSCSDNLILNAYFSSNPTGLLCDVYAGTSTSGVPLPNSEQSDSIKSRNGTEMTFQFFFDCHLPATPTPTTPPGVTPSPTPTPTPTPTIPPGVTPTAIPFPTPTPTLPPGVTPTATPVCTLPDIPVVVVTCTGCEGNGESPTPTNTSIENPTPTTSSGGPTPTHPVNTPTPTQTQSGPTPTPICLQYKADGTCNPNAGVPPTSIPVPTSALKPSGANCTDSRQCLSGVCYPNPNSATGAICQ